MGILKERRKKILKNKIIIASLLLLWILWGSTFLGIKVSIEAFPPFMMAGIRFTIAGVLLLLLLVARGELIAPSYEWKKAGKIAFFLLLGGQGCIVIGAKQLNTGTIAILWASVPIFIVLIDRVRYKIRPAKQTLFGIGICMFGIILLFSSAIAENKASITSYLLILGGSFSWAMGSSLSKKTHSNISSLMMTAQQMILGGLGLLLLSTLRQEWSGFNVSSITPTSLYGLIYLTVFGSFVGYSLFNWTIAKSSATVANTFTYICPIISILLGSLFLNEPIHVNTIGYSAIILFGIFFVVNIKKA